MCVAKNLTNCSPLCDIEPEIDLRSVRCNFLNKSVKVRLPQIVVNVLGFALYKWDRISPEIE